MWKGGIAASAFCSWQLIRTKVEHDIFCVSNSLEEASKPLKGLKTKTLRQGALVGFNLVRRETSVFEQGPKVLFYSHAIVDEYGLSFLRANIADLLLCMMSSEFLYRISACLKIQAVLQVGKATLRHQHLPNVVKELTEGFASCHCSGVTALDHMVFMEYVDETTLFLIRSSRLPTKKWCVLSYHLYQFALTYWIRHNMNAYPMEKSLSRPGPVFWDKISSHEVLRLSTRLTLLTRCIYSNMTFVKHVDFMRRVRAERNQLVSGSPGTSPFLMQSRPMAPRSGNKSDLYNSLCSKEAEPYPVVVDVDVEGPVDFTSRAKAQLVQKEHVLFQAPAAGRPSSPRPVFGRVQLNDVRRSMLSYWILMLIQSVDLVWGLTLVFLSTHPPATF